ncbi:hypothetical protein BpHYR1_041583 [Brachionus plicatilis]|uniref:Uncharacterized protein n=1 Tax=Brachionus plicatilis TaxID=10195 RepID=A0A3M7SRF2_BRAPC|nr:hypothetical protein BpHYR1_041583 [Brachionus plicatilis]
MPSSHSFTKGRIVCTNECTLNYFRIGLVFCLRRRNKFLSTKNEWPDSGRLPSIFKKLKTLFYFYHLFAIIGFKRRQKVNFYSHIKSQKKNCQLNRKISVKIIIFLSIESTFEELIFSKTTKLKPKIVYSEYEYIYEKTYVVLEQLKLN